jgi:prevent-host-death family protein
MRTTKTDATELPHRRITAKDMQRQPAAFQRRVLEEPVTITSNGEPTIVAMSVAEYRRLQARARSVLRAEELSDEDLAAIAAVQPAAESLPFCDEDSEL